MLLKLGMEHFAYPSPADRIGYIATRLKGSAWETIREKIDLVIANRTDPGTWPAGWNDYPAVLKELDLTYMVVNTKEEAKRDFTRLRQEGQWAHFSNFISEFSRLARQADIPPQQQVEALQQKINADLYNRSNATLDRPGDDDVSGWVQRYRNYASLMDEAKWRRNDTTNPKPSSNPNSHCSKTDPPPAKQSMAAPTAAPENPDAMQIDTLAAATTTKNGKSTYVSAPKGPLTAEEKKRRMDLGLCSYCGGEGHFASLCPHAAAARAKGYGRQGQGKV